MTELEIQALRITRAILALLVLAGCSTAPTEREIIAAHELVGFDWCSPAERHQCALIRQGGELMQMGHPSRIGDGTSLGGDVWDAKAEKAHDLR